MIHLPLDWEMYMEKYQPGLPEILDRIERDTHLKTTYPQMLSGKIQAGILHFLVKMIQPEKILEIGTFTGYATLAMASALKPESVIHTLEIDSKVARMAKTFFDQTPWNNQIELFETSAAEFLSQTSHMYDFVFLDADKENYPLYYELIKTKLSPQGLWITDNVLWSGKVLNPQDEQSKAIALFNEKIRLDPDLEQVFLPVRDGLMLIRFKNE